MSNLRKPEALQFLTKTITHPLFNRALRQIELVHRTYGYQPAGMMLVGETGLGKTTLLKYYASKANGSSQGSLEMPVLLVNTPASVSSKQVLWDAVKALGGEPGSRPTEAELNRMMRTLLKNRNTSLVIFDEFQHLAGATKAKDILQTANTIKNLMSDTEIPFVLAGLPESKVIIARHPELKRRFTQTIALGPLRVHSKDDLIYFRNYLQAIEDAVNECITGKVSGLATAEMASRFWVATQGMLGPISRIVEFALDVADLEKGVTQHDLAEGYRLFEPMESADDQNPFLMKSAALSKALGVNK